MNWKKVDSLEVLKSLGTLSKVAKEVQEALPEEKVPKTSWQKLYDFIQALPAEEVVMESWCKAKSLEEMKALGSFREIRQQVLAHSTTNTPKINSWQQLWELVEHMQHTGKH